MRWEWSWGAAISRSYGLLICGIESPIYSPMDSTCYYNYLLDAADNGSYAFSAYLLHIALGKCIIGRGCIGMEILYCALDCRGVYFPCVIVEEPVH